jgi:hypothetical protein
VGDVRFRRPSVCLVRELGGNALGPRLTDRRGWFFLPENSGGIDGRGGTTAGVDMVE